MTIRQNEYRQQPGRSEPYIIKDLRTHPAPKLSCMKVVCGLRVPVQEEPLAEEREYLREKLRSVDRPRGIFNWQR